MGISVDELQLQYDQMMLCVFANVGVAHFFVGADTGGCPHKGDVTPTQQ